MEINLICILVTLKSLIKKHHFSLYKVYQLLTVLFHLETRPHPLDLSLVSDQIATDGHSHENETGFQRRRHRTPSPGISPLSESSGQEGKNDPGIASFNKRKHEMVINESTLPVANTGELTS